MRWGIASALIAVLLALPASAVAAAPANDAFADSQALGNGLPIAETGTNREATKEVEEPTPNEFASGASGHTVWYEWEATATGLVTVSTCGSVIQPVLGVYTGSALGDLVEVAGNFASQGPDCPGWDGTAVTFEAVPGATYEVLVDGALGVFGDEGQGSFNLEIGQTPVPANDDFAAAEPITGGMFGRAYSAGADGFNWNATKEPGEPQHAGDPGGASVWYTWVAPFFGPFTVQACGRFEKSLLAVYTGSSVAALTSIVADDHSCNRAQLSAVAGATYRIAVDGKFDTSTGSALEGAISVTIFWVPPEEPPRERSLLAPSPPPAPETTIVRSTFNQQTRLAKFLFSSTVEGGAFQCKLDKAEFKFCVSPRVYKHLKPGRHTFRVRALAPSGLIDESAAVGRFAIAKPQRRR